MKNNEVYHAINCRVLKKDYESLQEVCDITNRTVAQIVSDSIVYYTNCIKGEQKPTEALQIDQFAYNLKQKGK